MLSKVTSTIGSTLGKLKPGGQESYSHQTDEVISKAPKLLIRVTTGTKKGSGTDNTVSNVLDKENTLQYYH